MQVLSVDPVLADDKRAIGRCCQDRKLALWHNTRLRPGQDFSPGPEIQPGGFHQHEDCSR